jgi:aquaporin Z
MHPNSPIGHLIHSAIFRRALMGVLVGSSVIAIIMSPWGRQSGGHFNPAITLTFFRLGKLAFWDTLLYVIAQFTGAVGGVGLAVYLLRGAPKHPSVHFAVTIPGIFGNVGAFLGEITISYVLMTVILASSDRKTVARFTPYLVGFLYTTFIILESPLSGMSMNPARTFGSAVRARYWQAFWIYLLAPTLGMLAAAQSFLWARGGIGPYCGKLNNQNEKRCIFRHGYSGGRVHESNFQGEIKMNKWKLGVPVLAIVFFAAFYAFRPDQLVTNRHVNEDFPVADQATSAEALESGVFSGVMHPTTGSAAVYRLADGDLILRFTNFRTSNGPDVHVYLVDAADAKDSATVEHTDFIDLGTIKGNIGDQNYTLGRDLDLSKYRTVSIWCKRFAVNFGAAPLKSVKRAMQN